LLSGVLAVPGAAAKGADEMSTSAITKPAPKPNRLMSFLPVSNPSRGAEV
jgi:hypothetical protein